MTYLYSILLLWVVGVSSIHAETSIQDHIKAAEQGDAKAQYNLGVQYARGEGVRQDMRMAKEWLGKACDSGLQLGCESYRKLNEKGY